MLKAKLESGTVKVTNYDDGMAEGVRLVLIDKGGNESEIALDILKDTGEARALIYKVGSDEPDEIISLNGEAVITIYEEPDIILEEDSYTLDESNGNLHIDKQIFDDYVPNSYIKIGLYEEGDPNCYEITEYKMIGETDTEIICEYIG